MLRSRFEGDPKDLLLKLQGIVDRVHGTGVGSRSPKTSITERNPSALFGAGLIDTISDTAIEFEAARKGHGQNTVRRPPGRQTSAGEILPVAGRVSRLSDGRIGRFGWKAQNATLADFAMNACAVELGLEVPDHHQAAVPGQTSAAQHGSDLDDGDCSVSSLSARCRHRRARSPRGKPMAWLRVKRCLPNGCAECHVRKLDQVDGIYSDLLLHDVGSKLRGAAYYGVFTIPHTPRSPGDLAAGSRLPKPNGACRHCGAVGSSGPYLHDGRATTLAAAIAEHGGEGQASADRFAALAPYQQQNLLSFLNSLSMPAGAERLDSPWPQ